MSRIVVRTPAVCRDAQLFLSRGASGAGWVLGCEGGGGGRLHVHQASPLTTQISLYFTVVLVQSSLRHPSGVCICSRCLPAGGAGVFPDCCPTTMALVGPVAFLLVVKMAL